MMAPSCAAITDNTTPDPIMIPKDVDQNESSHDAGRMERILQSRGTIQTCMGCKMQIRKEAVANIRLQII
jgi:hypothetical protein